MTEGRLVLGVETSCDDTSAAVVRDGREVLSNVVVTQSAHAPFSGVVPEIAAREHLRLLPGIIEEACAGARVRFGDLTGIAATFGPGLVGSLLVGLCTAKSLAYARGLPFVAVNHIEAHLLSIWIEEEVPPPFLGTVISGGHSELVLVRGLGDYRLLGSTRDDAAGEAFDKVAKLLGLGYPGGPAIDRAARGGDPSAFRFPRAWLEAGSCDLSFSGLKTAVRLAVGKLDPEERARRLADLAASFQEAVAEVLTEKILAAAKAQAQERIVAAGGVAANSRLRTLLGERARAAGIALHVPAARFCTDNAAMVALVGARRLERGDRSPWTQNAVATLEATGLAG
jgi:N6-L-threonylcarbamoyladenine synthase